MKKYITLGLLIALTSACSTDDNKGLVDGIGGEAANGVYMSNANASGVLSVLASDTEGASFVVTPRIATAVNEPIVVTLEVDTATLAAYNKANGLSTRPVLPEDVEFTNAEGETAKGKITATIKPGEYKSTVTSRLVSLDPKKYPYDGRYAIPVKITEAEGPLCVLSSPVSTVVNLNRKIKTSVMHLKYFRSNDYTQRFMPKVPYSGEEMSEWTVQYIALFKNLRRSNMTSASLSGGHGFYNRISKDSGLQAKTEGRDGVDTWTNKALNENEWLHVSYVYRKSGLVGRLSIYVNGELQKTFTTSLLYVDAADNAGWGFGNENVYDFYLREFRFWSRALTPAEIQDKLYLPENANSEGLEACFPMSREYYDAKEGVFLDITGKWKWQINEPAQKAYEIVDNVVFPAKTLVIEP